MKTTSPEADLLCLDAATTTPESPFQRPGSFGRRSMLAGMFGVGAALYLDTSPLTSRPAHAATPKRKPGKLGVTAGPFAINATSELSDDIFATSEVLIGADDELLPFYNPNSKVVEALVFTAGSGSLHHLHRDPTQATGWRYQEFDLQGVFLSVNDVAIAANNDGVYALILGVPGPNSGGSPYWLTWLDDATTWNEGYIAAVDYEDLPENPGPLKGGLSRQGVPYFYTTVTTEDRPGLFTTQLVAWVTNGNGNDPLDYYLLLTPTTTNQLADYILLFDTTVGDEIGAALILDVSGRMSIYLQEGKVYSDTPYTFVDDVSSLLWAWMEPGGDPYPRAAFQARINTLGGEGTFFLDGQNIFDGSDLLIRLADAPASGTNVVEVWTQNDLYTVNLLDSGGNLTVVHETGQGVWADPLLLTNGVPGSVQPGLVSVFGVPTDPAQATLFAIGADETLSVLSLDDTGWTQTQVRQDDVVGVQLTCYRLTISVVDTNGIPVPYGQAQLNTDRLVGFWQDIGSTIAIPGTPVTMTADISGQIILSVPAEELDTAVLTVQALDSNGQASGSPLSVAGDYDVRNFLGGTAALNNLGTMQGSTLTGAKNSDGSPLLPGLSADNASALATTLGAAITAGNGAPPAAGRPHAYRLELHGKTLKLSTSRDPNAYGKAAVAAASLSDFFHTLGHALRHGLAKVKSLAVSWAADLQKWVVQLETDLTDLATYVINDMRDAFHVIGGWLATLGADIAAVANWLKREVLGLLSSVGKNATTIGTVLGDVPTNLIAIVTGIEKQIDTWFTDQEETVNGWIDDLAKAVEDATFGASQPLTTPPSDTGSSTALNNMSDNLGWIMKVLNDTPGLWLYHKLNQYLPQDPGPDLSGVFDQVMQDLTDVWTGSVKLGGDIVNTVWTSVQALDSKDALNARKLSDWFGDVQAVVDDVLQLCNTIANTVLDFSIAVLNILDSYLQYQWSLFSINPILKLVLDELGFDPTISLNRLVSLGVAFPLTLIRTVTGQGPVFTPSASAATSDGWDTFSYTVAAISQGLWSVADLIGDVQSNVPDTGGKSGIIDYFDIICPLVNTAVLLPGRDGGLIWHGLPTDTIKPGLLPGAIYAAIVPSLFGIAGKAKASAQSPDPDTIPFFKDAPAKATPLDGYYMPIVSSISAAANAILGGYYSYLNGDKIEAIEGAVFGNVANFTSPLTMWFLEAELEDVPLAVKLFIDFIGGGGATVLYIKSA